MRLFALLLSLTFLSVAMAPAAARAKAGTGAQEVATAPCAVVPGAGATAAVPGAMAAGAARKKVPQPPCMSERDNQTWLATTGTGRADAPIDGDVLGRHPGMVDNVSLADYLTILERITPQARSAAERYLAAYRSRCGRDLGAFGLRVAVADGEPALMQTMRAGANVEAQTAAAAAVVCGKKP